jgi:hypothetical protein
LSQIFDIEKATTKTTMKAKTTSMSDASATTFRQLSQMAMPLASYCRLALKPQLTAATIERNVAM